MARRFYRFTKKMNYRLEYEQGEDEQLSNENEIVYTLDLDGNFTCLNQAGERCSGYSCDEVRRMNIAEVVAPELADYVRQQVTQTLRAWFGAVYEIEIITKDHRRVALETSTHMVWRDGRPIEIRGIAVAPIARSKERDEEERVRCLDSEFIFGTLFRTPLS